MWESTLNVITTRNEAVPLEEAGTASVAYVQFSSVQSLSRVRLFATP